MCPVTTLFWAVSAELATIELVRLERHPVAEWYVFDPDGLACPRGWVVAPVYSDGTWSFWFVVGGRGRQDKRTEVKLLLKEVSMLKPVDLLMSLHL